MSPLLALLLLVVAARTGGELAARLGQSSMLGEIVAGLVLGPTLFDLPLRGDALEFLSRLGILFLMFGAGLDTDLRLVRKVAGPSVIVSLCGQVLSFGLGYAAGWAFGLAMAPRVLLGAALSASSIVVTARVLGDYGQLRSATGLLAMAVNAIDDLIGMFVLLVAVSVVGQGGAAHEPIWLMLAKVLAFAVGAVVVGLMLMPLAMRLVRQLESAEMHFTFLVVLVLLFSWAAASLGLADVVGAFLAGAFLHYTQESEPAIISRVDAIGDGFLVPVFFAMIGLETNLRLLAGDLPFMLVVLLVAVVGKLVGCGGGARLAGFGWRTSYILGVGMIPRAEMTLVLLGIGLKANVLPPIVPPVLVSLVFLTAVVSSPLLRLGFRRLPPPPAQPASLEEPAPTGGAGPPSRRRPAEPEPAL